MGKSECNLSRRQVIRLFINGTIAIIVAKCDSVALKTAWQICGSDQQKVNM